MRHGVALPVGLAAVMVGSAATVAVAAAAIADRQSSPTMPFARPVAAACTVPSLPGGVVDVTLTDMGRRQGRGPMTGGGGMMRGPMMGGRMMGVAVSPTTAGAGTVSLRVHNAGVMVHELVVLPLGAGQQPGERGVQSDREIDETGSLGEASASCAAGSGDGIAPGSTGWVTLRLPAGRYELLCNLPGHYAAGMYAELDVT